MKESNEQPQNGKIIIIPPDPKMVEAEFEKESQVSTLKYDLMEKYRDLTDMRQELKAMEKVRNFIEDSIREKEAEIKELEASIIELERKTKSL